MPDGVDVEFDRFIEDLELLNIYQDSVEGSVKRDDLRDVLESDEFQNVEYEIEEKFSFRSQGENVFEVKASYRINGPNPMDQRKQLFHFGTDIVGVYESNRLPEETDVDKFIPSVKLNIWPYLREQIHSLTSRFDMPPLVLPPFKKFRPENVEETPEGE